MPSSTAKKTVAKKTAASSESTEQSTREPVPAHDFFVDNSTKENYRQMARDIAKTDGCSNAEALAKLADGFDQQHEADPSAGWGHLAAWARDEGDPGDGLQANLDAIEKARAVESARRDPKEALRSAPEAVAEAEAELERRAGSRGTAGVDADWVVPNTGPAVGVDVPSSSDDED